MKLIFNSSSINKCLFSHYQFNKFITDGKIINDHEMYDYKAAMWLMTLF